MKKTFIITGANRGLGKGFVDVLMKNQDNFVISISRRLSEEQKTYSAENFHFLETDLSQDNITEKLSQLNGKINTEALVFINNANIIEPIAKIENLEEAAIVKTLSVNIKATLLVTSFLLKNYTNNDLTFVNISSGAAKSAISNWSLYCCSKAYIEMFFNTAETEYPDHRFFNINPGVMDTGMQQSIRENDFPDAENFKDLQKDGQLKLPIAVAKEILKTIL
jgi:benzil reductase ((S)-benzoin forming)